MPQFELPVKKRLSDGPAHVVTVEAESAAAAIAAVRETLDDSDRILYVRPLD